MCDSEGLKLQELRLLNMSGCIYVICKNVSI